MEIRPTGAPISTIIEIGNKARKHQEQTKQSNLLLHAGINSVTQIDINQLVQNIDFNTATLQNYPGSAGRLDFREAINRYYFGDKADPTNILVTAGGTNGLYVAFKTLNISHILTPKFYWGTYKMLSIVNRLQHKVYSDFDELLKIAPKLDHTAVIISDPGNPMGDKTEDALLLEIINKLDSLGIPVIFDAPYRYLFVNENDILYRRLISLENVIINESFSKSIGLSGYRTGFLHNSNPLFIREAAKNILYCSNGVNVVGQEIIKLLLSTPQGRIAMDKYKSETVEHVAKNIAWLKQHNLLATDIYGNSQPIGIYAVINIDAGELEKYGIFGVPLTYFTADPAEVSGLTRICVSTRHDTFVQFFDPIAKSRN